MSRIQTCHCVNRRMCQLMSNPANVSADVQSNLVSAHPCVFELYSPVCLGECDSCMDPGSLELFKRCCFAFWLHSHHTFPILFFSPGCFACPNFQPQLYALDPWWIELAATMDGILSQTNSYSRLMKNEDSEMSLVLLLLNICKCNAAFQLQNSQQTALASEMIGRDRKRGGSEKEVMRK